MAAGVAVPSASASRFLQRGIFDDAQIHYGNPDTVFPVLRTLRTQLIRINLVWGGAGGVAKRRPANPTNPADPAYDWSSYDRTVNYAAQYGIKVVFSIVGTPPWANAAAGVNVVPRNALDLQRFAAAAARRYNGRYPGADGRCSPPSAPGSPGTSRTTPPSSAPSTGRSPAAAIPQSPIDYAKICNAIVKGISVTTVGASKVACGVTAPRGNNNPNSARPALAPIAFLRGMKLAGATGFDAYAHHPYYGSPSETPSTPPPTPSRGQAPTAITLGNIDVLIREVTKLYGNKRIWITEYGYQTNPPDPIFGVTLAKQATYLTQAFGIARRHPRIDMMLWFLLRDETRARIEEGWQSGLLTTGGIRKPSFAAFQRLAG